MAQNLEQCDPPLCLFQYAPLLLQHYTVCFNWSLNKSKPGTMSCFKVTKLILSLQLLQPIGKLFFFMKYLSLGLIQTDLAHRFKIRLSTVSCMINTWKMFILYWMLWVFGYMTHFSGLLFWTVLNCAAQNSTLLKCSLAINHCTVKWWMEWPLVQ